MPDDATAGAARDMPGQQHAQLALQDAVEFARAADAPATRRAYAAAGLAALPAAPETVAAYLASLARSEPLRPYRRCGSRSVRAKRDGDKSGCSPDLLLRRADVNAQGSRRRPVSCPGAEGCQHACSEHARASSRQREAYGAWIGKSAVYPLLTLAVYAEYVCTTPSYGKIIYLL